jgi:hypothetical protein
MTSVHPMALRAYEILKSYGFSPAKAAEIALDAKRGDKYALAWVDLALRASAPTKP